MQEFDPRPIAGKIMDPVCRKPLDPATTNRHIRHNGKMIHFCSIACRKAFKADPEKYGYAKRKGFWRRYLERMERATADRASSCRT